MGDPMGSMTVGVRDSVSVGVCLYIVRTYATGVMNTVLYYR